MSQDPISEPPISEFHALRRNTQLYAAWWLRDGQIHAQEHWYIGERLAPWRRAVLRLPEAEVRTLRQTAEAVLASWEAQPRPAPSGAWIMPRSLPEKSPLEPQAIETRSARPASPPRLSVT